MGRFVPRNGSDSAGEPQGVRCSEEEQLCAGTAIKEPLFWEGTEPEEGGWVLQALNSPVGAAWHLP